MATFDDLQEPVKKNLLVCFFDLSRFLDVGKKTDLMEGFDILNGMAVTTIRHIKKTKGRVIKFIGDSGLIVFPEDSVDEGVRALLQLRDEIIGYFKSRGVNIKVHFGIHYGEVAIGPFGEEPHSTIDVVGATVGRASVLAGREYREKFVISPQAFRKLKPETRKLFHKFTPPVVYIAE